MDDSKIVLRLRCFRCIWSLIAVALDANINDLSSSPLVQEMSGNPQVPQGPAKPKLPILSFAFAISAVVILLIYIRIELYKKMAKGLKPVTFDNGYSMNTIRMVVTIVVFTSFCILIRIMIANSKLQRLVFKFCLASVTDIIIPGMMVVRNQKIYKFAQRKITQPFQDLL